MKRNRRVGVLGTLVWDRIWLPGAAAPRESWGGIAYSLAGMAAGCPAGWEIVPLVKIGADVEPLARTLFDEMPGLVRGAEQVVPEAGNRVDLHYLDGAHRAERPSGGVPPWNWEQLEPNLGGLDALYVNFISGEEMVLETAEQLRERFGGPIFGDIHSLLLRHRAGGERFTHPLENWDRWIRCFDVVQINEVELATQAAHAREEPWRFARGIPGDRPRIAVVTLGERGAWYAAAGTDPRCIPVPEPIAGDPTGCGDVWGSTFFAGILGGAELDEAVLRAHRAAARKMTHAGATGLYRHLAGGSLPA